jgi:curli biogenesis system outer membrane secretion channel CsgG
MPVALRMAVEGSVVMALALLTATFYCALQSIASRRATATAVEPAEPAREALAEVRRPVFLSRSNLL